MKNMSFGALHSPLPSQSETQGRKLDEEIQHVAILHSMQNQEEEQLQN